jgi:hypothetical protein
MTDFRQFLSPISFAMPERVVASGWIEHGPFAMWLIEALQPRLTVELGSFTGYSACAFAEAIQSLGQSGKVIAVDTWQGDAHAGFYGDKVYDELKAHIDARFPGIVTMKRKRFCEALGEVGDGTVDLLHVDGRHFYEDVKEDHTSWIPKLSDRAVVLFHDTQVTGRDFGVYRYWPEVATEHASFEFKHGHGLGVLGFGRNLPPVVAALLSPDLPESVRQQVRDAYSRLGNAILDRQGHVRFKSRDDQIRKPVRFIKRQLRKVVGG